jgi:signal peptidase I
MPGDRLQMIDGELYINGTPVAREDLGEQAFETEGMTFRARAYRETLPNGVSYLTLDRGPSELDNTPVYTVPSDSYFMMGDDRDNSADSRVPSVIGYVPFEHLIGRVDHILPPG